MEEGKELYFCESCRQIFSTEEHECNGMETGECGDSNIKSEFQGILLFLLDF